MAGEAILEEARLAGTVVGVGGVEAVGVGLQGDVWEVYSSRSVSGSVRGRPLTGTPPLLAPLPPHCTHLGI